MSRADESIVGTDASGVGPAAAAKRDARSHRPGFASLPRSDRVAQRGSHPRRALQALIAGLVAGLEVIDIDPQQTERGRLADRLRPDTTDVLIQQQTAGDAGQSIAVDSVTRRAPKAGAAISDRAVGRGENNSSGASAPRRIRSLSRLSCALSMACVTTKAAPELAIREARQRKGSRLARVRAGPANASPWNMREMRGRGKPRRDSSKRTVSLRCRRRCSGAQSASRTRARNQLDSV